MSGGELLPADIFERVQARWHTLAQRIPGAGQTLDTVCASPLPHHIVASATSGLWRFTVQNRSELLTFIVKRIAPTPGASAHWQSTLQQSDPYYWAREADAYETAFFGDERGALRTAQCYLVDRHDDLIDLYLEDVSGEPGTDWGVDRYAQAAERLGWFQAAADVHPDAAVWLSGTTFLEAYVARRDDLYANAESIVRLPAPLLDNEGLRAFGPAVRQLWERREQILTFSAALPRTRCHHDFWSPNLFASGAPAQTIAIDLAFAGLGRPGEDAANLVADAVLDFFVPAADAEHLWNTVATSYVDGLSSGFTGIAQAARDVMTLSAALKFAWLIPATFQVASTPSGIGRITQRYGDSERFFRQRSAALRFIGGLVNRSLQILSNGN